MVRGKTHRNVIRDQIENVFPLSLNFNHIEIVNRYAERDIDEWRKKSNENERKIEQESESESRCKENDWWTTRALDIEHLSFQMKLWCSLNRTAVLPFQPITFQMKKMRENNRKINDDFYWSFKWNQNKIIRALCDFRFQHFQSGQYLIFCWKNLKQLLTRHTLPTSRLLAWLTRFTAIADRLQRAVKQSLYCRTVRSQIERGKKYKTFDYIPLFLTRRGKFS